MLNGKLVNNHYTLKSVLLMDAYSGVALQPNIQKSHVTRAFTDVLGDSDVPLVAETSKLHTLPEATPGCK